MEDWALHRRAVEEWLQRVAAVDDEQWRRPTPCADWDVRALVNHVVGEELVDPPAGGGQHGGGGRRPLRRGRAG